MKNSLNFAKRNMKLNFSETLTPYFLPLPAEGRVYLECMRSCCFLFEACIVLKSLCEMSVTRKKHTVMGVAFYLFFVCFPYIAEVLVVNELV